MSRNKLVILKPVALSTQLQELVNRLKNIHLASVMTKKISGCVINMGIKKYQRSTKIYYRLCGGPHALKNIECYLGGSWSNTKGLVQCQISKEAVLANSWVAHH